ncbi:MAG TPA: hypothetical protein VHH53_06920, partial [Pseudonocardiaceae bacterium]|nr:hypothetical protein [Pseudonocardiaceae bacterium]
MIILIVAGIGLLVLVAIVVGFVEATQAPTWRQIAAERRARWEAKQPQLHGFDPYAAPPLRG